MRGRSWHLECALVPVRREGKSGRRKGKSGVRMRGRTTGVRTVTGGAGQVVRARVSMGYARGMHARPALLLAQRAREFQADVTLVLVSCPVEISTPAGTRADAKSMLDLMFLQAPCGSELEVEAVGADAEAAVEAITALFQDRFGIRD